MHFTWLFAPAKWERNNRNRSTPPFTTRSHIQYGDSKVFWTKQTHADKVKEKENILESTDALFNSSATTKSLEIK